MPTLTIITAATRPGAVGPAVTDWFAEIARRHERFDVTVVDLGELALPFMDEPKHPMLGLYTHQHTKDWSATVAASDAFVFVMPEYNHSYPATLKNAIDFLSKEWNHKPVGFVSYGGVSAGLRSVTAIKPVVSCLKMVPVTEAVSIPMISSLINEDGVLVPNDIMNAAARLVLNELARWNEALTPMRRAIVPA